MLEDATEATQRSSATAAVSSGRSPHLIDEASPEELRPLVPATQPRKALTDPAPPGTEECVLLTGATGYLGVFLLEQLLRADPLLRVVCLVRATGAAQALSRLQRTADRYGAFLGPQDWARVEVLVGDLQEPRLGLAIEKYQDLADQVDAIYHSAAAVNWVDDYAALAPATVDGTQQITSLTGTGRPKRLNYVSSLAVFPFDGVASSERDSLDHGRPLLGGYAQAKWVAEQIVHQAVANGLAARIYRPSIITGQSSTGVFNPTSYFENVIRGCLEIGALPDSGVVDIVPVDYVARALVTLSRRPDVGTSTVFHLNHPQSLAMSEFADWLRDEGRQVQLESFEDWKDLAQIAMGRPDSSLYPFRRHLGRVTRSHLSIPPHSCTRTIAFLDSHTVSCPPVKRLLGTYFRRFEDDGFLEAPHV